MAPYRLILDPRLDSLPETFMEARARGDGNAEQGEGAVREEAIHQVIRPGDAFNGRGLSLPWKACRLGQRFQ